FDQVTKRLQDKNKTRMFRNNNWSTSAMVPSFFQGETCAENFIDDVSNSEWTGNSLDLGHMASCTSQICGH
ncbi:unnamed protein product, partial [Allacma fusca]